MRRASPSNSISASATREWVSRGDQHRASRADSQRPDAIADPWSRSPRAVRCSGRRSNRRAGASRQHRFASRRLGKLLYGVLIEAYKLSQIHREGSAFVLAEWGPRPARFSRRLTRMGETQRVQARVHQRQFIVSFPGGKQTRKPQLQPEYAGARSCCDTRHGSDPDCSARKPTT